MRNDLRVIANPFIPAFPLVLVLVIVIVIESGKLV